ncbi:MAG: hypothetical protein ABMB14_29675 [Myxococcota bacterium]
MAERSGCLSLLVPPAALRSLGGSGLARIDPSTVHPLDRPALARAQAAAEAAHRAFTTPDAPEIAVADLADRLSKLLAVVHRLAVELARARRFLERNDPDRLARERTDLELRRLGATAGEILALRTASEALSTRSRLAEQVRGDLATLTARLHAAAAELEAFRARVEARTDAAALGLELATARDAAQSALDAYDRTRRELEALA